MTLGDLILVGVGIAWFVHAANRGRVFEHAWVGLCIGVALMLSRRSFVAGAVLAAVSFALITLPMARAEWNRVRGAD
ncbi:MAG TPA: hypothetical protein VK081_09405, partial [Planctomycetota bacterium]|nr:hypothetical protein [Planctomycetota bacterium]